MIGGGFVLLNEVKKRGWNTTYKLKSSKKLIEQASTSPPGTLEFNLDKSVDTSASNPPWELEEEKSTIAGTNSEVYNSIFKNTEQYTITTIYSPGSWVI